MHLSNLESVPSRNFVFKDRLQIFISKSRFRTVEIHLSWKKSSTFDFYCNNGLMWKIRLKWLFKIIITKILFEVCSTRKIKIVLICLNYFIETTCTKCVYNYAFKLNTFTFGYDITEFVIYIKILKTKCELHILNTVNWHFIMKEKFKF